MSNTNTPVRKTRTKRATGKRVTTPIGAEPTRKVKSRPAKTTVVHGRVDAASRYAGLPRPHFSGMTVAALAAAGFIRLTPNCASASSLMSGDPDKFGKVVGQKAKDYWKRNFMEDGKRLNKSGMANVEQRLKGTGSYKTTGEIVKSFYAAIRKGGTVKVGKSEYKFDPVS